MEAPDVVPGGVGKGCTYIPGRNDDLSVLPSRHVKLSKCFYLGSYDGL